MSGRKSRRPSTVVARERLDHDLRRLGVEPGDVIVVHSSLSRLGLVEGGADTVIDALLACIGPLGTLVVPALTLGRHSARRPPPPFDPRTAPSVVGIVAESVRARPESVRSLHPTHSVAAIGHQAVELLRDHQLSETPCGPSSPWGRLAQGHGKVLMLGIDTSSCTLFHGPEEVVEPDARCTPPIPCSMVLPGGPRTFELRLHRPYRGAVSDRAGMAGLLRGHGLLREGRVGEGSSVLIDAHGLWAVSLDLLRARPSTRLDGARAHARQLAERLLRR